MGWFEAVCEGWGGLGEGEIWVRSRGRKDGRRFNGPYD